jgi:hypothetical protein
MEEVTKRLDNSKTKMGILLTLRSLDLVSDKEFMVLYNWLNRLMKRDLYALRELSEQFR